MQMHHVDGSALLAPSSLTSEPKSRAKSCTECRQVKLKCDYREKAPEDCTRCTKRGLECKKDATFKRVPSRVRRQQQQQQQQQQQRRSLSATSSPTSDVSYSDPTVKQQGLNPLAFTDGRRDSDRSPFLKLESFSAEETFTTGDITLSSHTVVALFQHFEKRLWPQFPLLEPCYSLSQLHTQSQILFWVLVAVSSRYNPQHPNLYGKLAAQFEDNLFQRLFLGGHSMKRLHAMLLLCLWPFQVSSQEHDTALTLSGALVNTAMMLGLHKVDQAPDYHELRVAGPSEDKTRQLTWLACLRIATVTAAFHNFPPPITTPSSLRGIATLCSTANLDSNYCASALIQARVTQLVTALDSGLDPTTSQRLLQHFEQDLMRTRSVFAASWTIELEAEMLFTNLYAVGTAFVVDSNDDAGTMAYAHSLIERGLILASSLINSTTHRAGDPWLPPTTAEAPPPHASLTQTAESLRYHPKPFFRHLTFASYFLIFFASLPQSHAGATSDPSVSPPYQMADVSAMPQPNTAVPSPVGFNGATPSNTLYMVQSSLSFVTALFGATTWNDEGPRIGRSIIMKAKYAMSTKGTVPLQYVSRIPRVITSPFDRLGDFLREAAVSTTEQVPGPRPTIEQHIPVSMPQSIDSSSYMAASNVNGGAWMDTGPSFEVDVQASFDNLNAHDMAEQNMNEVFNDLNMNWDVGQGGWNEADFEALAAAQARCNIDARSMGPMVGP